MASASASSKVWRVEEPVRRLAVCVALFCLFVAAFLTAIGVVFPRAAVLWVMAIGAMLCMWRWCLVPYVALTPDHLEVQGVLSRRSVGYGSIRRVTPGSLGLRLETADDGRILIWAIQKSKFAEWLHQKTRADDIAAEIMERVESAEGLSVAA
jgi:hypothetical protein